MIVPERCWRRRAGRTPLAPEGANSAGRSQWRSASTARRRSATAPPSRTPTKDRASGNVCWLHIKLSRVIPDRGQAAVNRPSTALDPAAVDRVLEDAAHYPGGTAAGVLRPRSIDEVSAALRDGGRILPVGAQSSLTGGATPFGDIVLSTERLNVDQRRRRSRARRRRRAAAGRAGRARQIGPMVSAGADLSRRLRRRRRGDLRGGRRHVQVRHACANGSTASPSCSPAVMC